MALVPCPVESSIDMLVHACCERSFRMDPKSVQFVFGIGHSVPNAEVMHAACGCAIFVALEQVSVAAFMMGVMCSRAQNDCQNYWP